MSSRTALITGITGQDGSYLAELLLAKGYTVHGLVRRASTFHTQRLDQLYRDPHEHDTRLLLRYGDLSDSGQLTNLFYEVRPDEVYHLGAQSHVGLSFEMPSYTGDVTGLGTARLLEAIRRSGVRCRFYQASTSEMFGDAPVPQSEQTHFRPRSPYGAAKVYAYWMVRNYREGYGLFTSNGIMFNHESPRRGETFVSRKITRGIAEILAGRQRKVFLGNLDAKRDWGYAPEYVEGIWLMLQHDGPADLVFGTGETHSVEEFVEEAFSYVNLDWRDHIAIDSRYLRPTEVQSLQADASEAKRCLGWEPRVRFRDLVRIMVDADSDALGLATSGNAMPKFNDGYLGWLQRP